MSYDLHLFRAPGGSDLLRAAHASLDADEEALNPGAPVAEKEQRKRRLADALISQNPGLDVFPFGYEDIAESEGISVEEARMRWRHLELSGPEDGNGIQITLFDDTASVTVPYWHSAAEAEAVWQEIWDYLQVLTRQGEFDVYDPQLERLLDLRADQDVVREKYLEGVPVTRRAVDEGVGLNRPWWKLW